MELFGGLKFIVPDGAKAEEENLRWALRKLQSVGMTSKLIRKDILEKKEYSKIMI